MTAPDCLLCGHGFETHGDRAVAACSPGQDPSATYSWQKVRCNCPGYEPEPA